MAWREWRERRLAWREWRGIALGRWEHGTLRRSFWRWHYLSRAHWLTAVLLVRALRGKMAAAFTGWLAFTDSNQLQALVEAVTPGPLLAAFRTWSQIASGRGGDRTWGERFGWRGEHRWCHHWGLLGRLGSLGRHAEAETALRALLAGPHAASALVALTDLRVLQQDWRGALALLRDAVQAHPGDSALQTRLAGMAWMLGDSQHFAEALQRGVAERPDDRGLRLALIGVLDNAGRGDAAEREMREGLTRHSDDYHFAALLAARCAVTGRMTEAETAIITALARAPELGFVREQAAIVALVAGRAVDALAHTAWLVDRSPTGQTAWSLRTLALRLAGDSSWRTIADPTLVCRQAQLQPPSGYASLNAFNDVLASRLRTRHTLQAHPLVNSVRGGTQVEIHPGSESDPVLRAFFEMIRAPITEYISSMPDDPSHPLFARKAGAYRLSGCWSVRLEGGGGHHVGHIHPRGWISSAYYVTVPPEIRVDAQRAGWLAFGKPPYPVPGLSPTGWVQPELGRLALFPSYQWHGVEPYPGRGERMTIAFDVMPIATPATR